MTLSDFWVGMDAVFGSAFGRVLFASQVVPSLDFRTPADAIEAGVRPASVWEALCDEMGIGELERWRHTLK